MPPAKPPEAKSYVASPDLWRPDWTKGAPRDPRLLWLDKNENSDPALNALVRRLIAEVPPETYFTYPETAPLYAKLAYWVGVNPDCLLLTAGSDGAIRSVFEAYVAPGDLVIHTRPTFAMYAVYSQMYGARTLSIDYEPGQEGPVLPFARLLDSIRSEKPRLVCLPNPDSPTGTLVDHDRLESLAAATRAAGAVLLIDEAYHPFHADSVAQWVRRHDHLIVARTFAKAWGMAGLRIGYAVAAPPAAVMLHKVRPMYEANTLAVAIAESMLDHRQAMLDSVARLNAGKAVFLDSMRDLGFHCLDGAGNFLHVAFGARAHKVHAALADLVLYRKDFREPCLKGFSRFSATTSDIFAPVIARIEQTVRGKG